MKKTDYYENEEVVDKYISFRYGGKSGAYVNNRELETVKSFLPESGVLLDIPAGIGRLTGILTEAHVAVAADYSHAMLGASSHLYEFAVRADALRLPFADKSFDVVVSLRFLIHYADIRPFLNEFMRVLKDDGVLIIERYRWTPLILNVFQRVLGGKTYIHRKRKLLRLLEELGFELVARRGCFLFSPFVYARLPVGLVGFLDLVERLLPESVRVDDYWAVRKRTSSRSSSRLSYEDET